MSIEPYRLQLAVRVVSRAFRAAPQAPVADRLTAFRLAYAAIADLERGPGDWAQDCLEAAWDLVEPAHPAGGSLETILAALAEAHAAVTATARPPADPPPRPRRDA